MSIIPPYPTFSLSLPPFPTYQFAPSINIAGSTYKLFNIALPNISQMPAWIAGISEAIGTAISEYILEWIFWIPHLIGNLWSAGFEGGANYGISAEEYATDKIQYGINQIIDLGRQVSAQIGVSAPIGIAISAVITILILSGIILLCIFAIKEVL